VEMGAEVEVSALLKEELGDAAGGYL